MSRRFPTWCALPFRPRTARCPRSAGPRLFIAAIAAAFAVATHVELRAQRTDTGSSRSSSSSSSGNPINPERFPRYPVFFPPNPPALGRPIGRTLRGNDGRMPAPAALAPHVSEFFYPALGSRLLTNSLDAPLHQRVDAYRQAKLALQHELRTELARVRDAEPAERLQALETLARAQAARLTQLETEAEALRRELTVKDHTWNARRQWRLGDRDRAGFSPLEIAQVMRAYAFHQHGLLPAQRRLLREISVELLMAAEDPEKAAAAQPHVFFPPEPARVLFPDDMPAAAATKLAAYQTKKSALKKELYDAIHRRDGETFGFLRGNTIAALATRQSAPLAELERLAEEIRRLLPPQAGRPPPERSSLPVAVVTRINKMITAYADAQRDAAAQIDAILARARGLPFQSQYRFDPDGLRFVVVPSRNAARQPDLMRRIVAVREEIGAVAETYGRTLADLVNERDAIRRDIAEALRAPQENAIDAALLSGIRAAHQQQNAAGYEEYRVAVFEPGLSAAQRRLLFDAVIETLELPLPHGELQPTHRTHSW